MLLGIAQVLGKLLVELSERVSPLLFAFLDFVEFFFQPRRVLHIEDVAKILDQQIGNHQSDLSWHEFPAEFLHILPLLNRAEDGRVRRRTSDTAFFQFFHQRGFVVARRRLGEVLLRLDFAQRQFLTRLERRQLVF